MFAGLPLSVGCQMEIRDGGAGGAGETLAAMQAAEQRGRARDPEVCRVLDRIAADEAAHAELAWAFVRWAIALAPLRAAREPERDGGDAAAWHDNGRLTDAERARCHLDAVREVIGPCVNALLSAPPAPLRAPSGSAEVAPSASAGVIA